MANQFYNDRIYCIFRFWRIVGAYYCHYAITYIRALKSEFNTANQT